MASKKRIAGSESVGAGHVRKCWKQPYQKAWELAVLESIRASHVRKCQKVSELVMSESVGARTPEMLGARGQAPTDQIKYQVQQYQIPHQQPH
jgi:hypothetical protein